ncbi:unnamed protein product [Prorocentrum cordatum]|uniref:EF-hand domain-containing protein n=1 Tax=Prorocentrum cordatum TaxID=2364126 RepID=A0ABN9UK11_9DINO|nr:unnamed protein product [Polarella glacialis]
MKLSRQGLQRQDEGRLRRLAGSVAFELVVAAAIVANGLFIAAEAEYNGFEIAADIGYAGAETPSAEEVWPDAELVFRAAYWCFGVFFTIEILIKIAGERGEFTRNAWNWIDLVLVLSWIFSLVFNSSINPQIFRNIRLIRVFRIARLLRFMRGDMSDSSFIMVTALQSCVITAVWAVLLFFVIHCALALVINEALVELYFFSETTDDVAKEDLFVYFGSFSRSFLTMFELTFANWVAPTRVLMENVGEAFVYYAILHKCIVGIAVAGVVGAVFIHETLQVVQQDDAILVRQALRREKAHATKMQALFAEFDQDCSGTVTKDEFNDICRNEWVQIWLRAQEIKVQDASSLFELIDNGDGHLTAEELVKGTSALKGTSAIVTILRDLRQTRQYVRDIKDELLLNHRDVKAQRTWHL